MKSHFCQVLLAFLVSFHVIYPAGYWEIEYRLNNETYIDQIRSPEFVIDPYRDFNNEGYDQLSKIIYLSPLRVSDLWR